MEGPCLWLQRWVSGAGVRAAEETAETTCPWSWQAVREPTAWDICPFIAGDFDGSVGPSTGNAPAAEVDTSVCQGGGGIEEKAPPTLR